MTTPTPTRYLFGSQLRWTRKGQLCPQTIMISDDRRRDSRGTPVVVEIHCYFGLREARAAFPALEAEARARGLRAWLSNKTFLIPPGQLGSVYRRERGEARRACRIVKHYQEHKTRFGFTYSQEIAR